MSAHRSLVVRPVALQGELEETRYRKRDDGKYYAHAGSSDLWLVETSDGKRGTLSLPRRGAGWTRDGRTYWLTNSPHEGTRMSKSTSARKTKKRTPPRGFKTWSAYMASIRPGGKKMAKAKKRGRKASSTRKAVKRRRSVAVANPPRRRRRHRNPPMMNDIMGRLMSGAVGGLTIVATEAGTRLIRSRALGMPAGTLLSGATELGISTGAGLLAGKFLGTETGQRVIDAGFASVIRAAVKQLGVPLISDALGDDGGGRRYVIRNGRALPRRLNGYVAGPARTVALGGYVSGFDTGDSAAALMANAGAG